MPLSPTAGADRMSDPTNNSGEFAAQAGRGIAPAVRQRLEALHARAKACVEKGDLDYAHDLLAQCVAEDPGSLTYLQTFRANIAKKHPGAEKKTSRFGSLGVKTGRGSVTKHSAKGHWPEAFTAGCHALKKNPVDLPVLREAAAGCGTLSHVETQLYWLRWAMDIDLHDIETNRAAGEALGKAQQFDHAIACWQRVLKQKPDDEQARKEVNRMSVEQTLHQGGYDHELLKNQAATDESPAIRVAHLASKSDTHQAMQPAAAPAASRSQEELLEIVQSDPNDLDAALELSAALITSSKWHDAIRLLKRAMGKSADPESPQHQQIEEELLRVAGLPFEAAQNQAKQDRSEALIQKAKDAAKLKNKIEQDVYANRVKHTPGDTRSQFELGLRLKRSGEHREAIKVFQAARSDTRRAAEVQVHLGECFQHIEQFKLAASSYEAAIAASDGASEDTRKLALYRAGALALGLGDLDRAESRLTELAALDFGYRDVSDRLDNIAEMRKNA